MKRSTSIGRAYAHADRQWWKVILPVRHFLQHLVDEDDDDTMPAPWMISDQSRLPPEHALCDGRNQRRLGRIERILACPGSADESGKPC